MMSLEKIRPTNATTIVICIGTVFSVLLSIFLLNRPLFLSLELFKLLAVAFGLASTILVWNSMVLGQADKKIKPPSQASDLLVEEIMTAHKWGAAGMVSIIGISLGTVICYGFKWKLSHMYWGLAGAEIMFFFLVIREEAKRM